MSSSFRGFTLCLALALISPLVATAQSLYSPSGGELRITGPLAGSQTHPAAAVSPSGGFLVWQDNNADKDGLGLRALALDSNFSSVGLPFRVNKSGARDQENPCVVLPSGGGAVFVWQGGRTGFQHIYARFLSSSNTWLTTDLLVSTNKNPQSTPAAAALANGNIAIVWASLNQAAPNSMKDIYGQIFTSAGQPVGTQFLVNQFTSFNQRNPAITPLNDGRFLVAWVSEQQSSGGLDNPDPNFAFSTTNPPSSSSVEIYARFFGSDGLPAAVEFLVNTGPELCATPSVAADTNGGFLISWGQKNPANRTSGWDVFARHFSNVGPGPSRPINTFVTGNQYGPHVSAIGSDFLIVWTSVGQDGSWEGVYGQYLDGAGSPVGGEFRVNTTTLGRQLDPALASDQSGRFLSVWSSFTGLRTSMDIFAQIYASSNFVASAGGTNVYSPPPPEIFDDSSGDHSSPPILDPPPVVSNPGSNSFSSANASYSGFFYDKTNGVSPSSSGSFNLSVTDKGALSARFNLGGRSYSLSAKIDSSGRASGKISRGALHSLNVQLQLDDSGSVQGSITDGGWVSQLFGNRSISSARKSLAAPYVGSYTLDIPGIPYAGNPAGDGFGTVKVDASGNVKFAASLADGTKISQTAALSETGIWPLYASVYQGLGEVIGWMQFTSNSVGGQLVWIKQSAALGKIYPSGFTNQVDALGSLYQPPPKGKRALELSNGSGSLALTGGGINTPLVNPIALDLNNRVTSAGNSSLKVSITASTGLFKGSVLNPDTGKSLQFQGALFPDRNVALGYFLGPAGGGQISLEPAP